MSTPEIVITHVANHYGTPTVWVEPFRTADKWGDEVEVVEFWLNGAAWPTATGAKIRKDGQPANRRQSVDVAVPSHVLTALRAL